MSIWIALIIAPLLALADQSVAFSLVSWSCAHQSVLWIHLSHSMFLSLLLVTVFAVSRMWLRTRIGAGGTTERLRQNHFLSGVAAVVASLSALAVIAMWLPTWIVSACIA